MAYTRNIRMLYTRRMILETVSRGDLDYSEEFMKPWSDTPTRGQLTLNTVQGSLGTIVLLC